MLLTESNPPAASSGLQGSIYDTFRATSAEVRIFLLLTEIWSLDLVLLHSQVESRLPELRSASSEFVRLFFSDSFI
jgi:hypothetical protein